MVPDARDRRPSPRPPGRHPHAAPQPDGAGNGGDLPAAPRLHADGRAPLRGRPGRLPGLPSRREPPPDRRAPRGGDRDGLRHREPDLDGGARVGLGPGGVHLGDGHRPQEARDPGGGRPGPTRPARGDRARPHRHPDARARRRSDDRGSDLRRPGPLRFLGAAGAPDPASSRADPRSGSGGPRRRRARPGPDPDRSPGDPAASSPGSW